MSALDHDVVLRGLDQAEVADRVVRGDVNTAAPSITPTVRAIVARNVLTRFNAILGTLFLLVVAVGDLRDALFGLVLVANSGIGLLQELRAKRLLDRLAVVAATDARVVRDGRVGAIAVQEVVLDDVLEVSIGDELVVDGVVVTSDGLELDESLLTGEAEPVHREVGATVLSGSVVMAGTGRYRATAVGARSHANDLTTRARRFTLVRSELATGIDQILRLTTWGLVPAGTLLVVSQLRAHTGWADAVAASVAGLVAMVPEGLVLLTSTAFAVGAQRLARRRALVRELPTVEALARVDVLCVDKTGTLTEGVMVVDVIESLVADVDVEVALGAVAAADPTPNATIRAVAARCPAPAWEVVEREPFSSSRRRASATFRGRGTWVLGAPTAVLEVVDPGLRARIADHTSQGRRVLALARHGRRGQAEPMALVGIADRVRPEVATTLQYFADQGVAVRVISGDDPHTVAALARRAGLPLEGDAVDASRLPADPQARAATLRTATVLGRVAPEQKLEIVTALQDDGHVVAMTGDGVNDVLALKQADVGVAMGSGTGAARGVAQLVLLDDDFSVLTAAVGEGRRVIANIERVAGLFVTKSVYAFLLAVAIGIAGWRFPFLPRHLTLVASLTIGVPGLVLALSPSAERARPGFTRRVLATAAPAGLLAAVATFIGYGVARDQFNVSTVEAQTSATIVLLAVGLVVLARVAAPLTRSRRLLVAAMWAAFLVVLAVPTTREFFALDPPPAIVWLSAIGLVSLADRALQAPLGAVADAARTVAGWLGRTRDPATRRQLLRTVVSVGMVLVVFVVVLPRLADLSQVRAAVTDMTWLEVSTLVLASVWNLLTYQLVMMAALPGIRLSQAFLVGQASTAVSVALPAGSAIGIGVTYRMYSSMGWGGSQVALGTVLTGLWNTFVKLGLPIVALLVLALTGASTGPRLGLALVGVAVLATAIAIFAGMLFSPRIADRVGRGGAAAIAPVRRLLRRPPVVGWGEAAVTFREDAIGLLRRRWPVLTVASIVSHLSLFLVLLLALRHMGVPSSSVTWPEALVAFASVRLVTILPITPGSLGVTELALTGALVLAGGARTPVVAAVLVYRFLTLVVQVVIGAGCWLYWQTTQRVSPSSASTEGTPP